MTGNGTTSRRRRTVLGWWSVYGAHVGFMVGLAGVALGYTGYRWAYDDASWWDSLYAALQLLVLSGGVAPPGVPTPWALNVGRFLCALAFGSAFLLLMMRLGAATAGRVRAQLTRKHRVVFGTTPEARQLVLVGETGRPRRRRLRCDAVLVGELDEKLSMELRRDGVVVIGACDDELLTKVIHGAKSIVVAEHDDIDALAIMRRVRHIVESERIPLKVVFRSSALAETIRARRQPPSDNPVVTSVVSLPEAAALRLTQFDRFPTEFVLDRVNIVVAGGGELAGEIAIASVLRGLDLPSAVHRIVLDLVAEPDETWPATVAKRLGHNGNAATPTTNVELRRHAAGPTGSEVAECVLELCAADHAQHQVFVAGLADTDVIVAGTRLGLGLSNSRVVSVLERDAVPTELSNIAGERLPTMHWVTLGELIEDPRLLRISLQERLGTSLLARLEERRKAHAGAVLEHLLSNSTGTITDTSATEFATFLIETLSSAGLKPEPRLKVTKAEPLIADHRKTVRSKILGRFPPSAETNQVNYQAHIGNFVNEVPQLFAALGFDLKTPER